MRMVAIAAAAAAVLGCVKHNMVRAEPVQLEGQDVVYKNGMPIIISKREGSAVVIQPMAGVTGRYDMRSRVGFVAAIYNLSPRRTEVSETSFSAIASGERTHVLRAAEIEDEIRASAAWAQTFNAVAGALVIATSRSSVARYYVAQDAARNAGAIETAAQARTTQLASALQRTTLDAGESVVGGVSIEAPRATACSPDPVYEDPNRPGSYLVRRPGPCRWTIYVTVGDEKHVVQFNEALGL